MKTIVIVAAIGLTAVAGPGLAQGAGPSKQASPAQGSCYIELAKLMAEPPTGIGELGTALRELDVALRPQVDHVNQLRTRIARLEQRQAAVSTGAVTTALELEPVGLTPPLTPADESTLAEMQELQAELDERRAKLKADYQAQQTALVGPVQARVSQGARTYAAEQGCSGIRMARSPELPALAAEGARDLTASFVAWYTSNQPAPARNAR